MFASGVAVFVRGAVVLGNSKFFEVELKYRRRVL